MRFWVSADGNDANDGSKNSPVATIAKAIELAKKFIYNICYGRNLFSKSDNNK